MVIAGASGIFCSEVKNKNSAVVPNSPRNSSSVRLLPFQSAPARCRPTRQIIVATRQRKNTISDGGMCGTCFTSMFASEKASVDKNIERTPTVRNVPLPLKLYIVLRLEHSAFSPVHISLFTVHCPLSTFHFPLSTVHADTSFTSAAVSCSPALAAISAWATIPQQAPFLSTTSILRI